jgi:diguanylate cyclase (GGDEF)-like protein
MYEKMQKLSYFDQLTGLGNRHAVDSFMENIDHEKSLGIVYCDVMGLKKINDKYGHKAGDDLIVRACQSLQEVFGDYSLFRMGGDEFLVLCSGIKEDELNKGVERLKSVMKDKNALMAVGSDWQARCVDDIDKLIVNVDAKMYEDKRQYYDMGLSRT